MQINIRSSSIIIFKHVGEFLTKNEILKQAGISFTDSNNQPLDNELTIKLGGGAFDNQGYQVTTPLVNSKIAWEVVLPDGQILDETANALTLTLVTDEAEYHSLKQKRQTNNDVNQSVENRLSVANHRKIVLGQERVNKPLPTVSLTVPTNYDIHDVKMIVYPIVGSGTNVNKNLVDYGITVVDDEQRTVTWSPKTQDLYPFGPADNEITSLMYAIQAHKYQPVIENSWGFDPTALLAKDSSAKPQDTQAANADTVAYQPTEAQASEASTQVNEPSTITPTKTKPKLDDTTVTNKTNVPHVKSDNHITTPEVNKIGYDEPLQSQAKEKQQAEIDWYKQKITGLTTNFQAVANKVTKKVKAKQKQPKKVAKPKKAKSTVKNTQSQNTSNHGILKFIITVLVCLGIVGSGTYIWREESLKPYQSQIATVKQNQDQMNSLLDQKQVSINNLQKAVQLASTNSKLIKQLPVSDNNIWRTMAYNQLEYQNERLVAKAKQKQVNNENNK